MSSLPTLIRLKQQQLDEKRLVVTRLETEAASIKSLIDNLDIEVAVESEKARANADHAYGYGTYLASARVRRAGLEGRLVQVHEKIAAAADEVAEAFREMKRFELAQTFAEQRAAAEANRRERTELDDMGLEGYRRARTRGRLQ